MKFLKSAVIIFGITMAGEFLNQILPFPIPAGVYGLFLLLIFLCIGAVKLEEVETAGDFFLDIMPLMFVPAGVGLMNSIEELKEVLLPMIVITLLSTIFVMLITGKAAQYMIRKRKK